MAAVKNYATQQPGMGRSFKRAGRGRASTVAALLPAEAETFVVFIVMPCAGAPQAMQVTDFAVMTSPQQVQKAAIC